MLLHGSSLLFHDHCHTRTEDRSTLTYVNAGLVVATFTVTQMVYVYKRRVHRSSLRSRGITQCRVRSSSSYTQRIIGFHTRSTKLAISKTQLDHPPVPSQPNNQAAMPSATRQPCHMVRGFALCSVCKQITLRFWNVYGYCDRSDGGCNFGGIAQWAAGTINDGEMCGNCRASQATRAAQAAKTTRR